jgi:hypothetical protein
MERKRVKRRKSMDNMTCNFERSLDSSNCMLLFQAKTSFLIFQLLLL